MLLKGTVGPDETLCDNHTINQLGIFHECEKKLVLVMTSLFGSRYSNQCFLGGKFHGHVLKNKRKF